MSNLITDILKSYFDFNENKTMLKSQHSGILENKVKKDFEFFKQDSGAFNTEEIFSEIQKMSEQEKKIGKSLLIKIGGGMATMIWIFFIFFFASSFFKVLG